jgi:hypothetical protein
VVIWPKTAARKIDVTGIQLRLEAYNVLNHTEFNGIGTNMTMLYRPGDPVPQNISTNLGQYISTRPSRVLATTVRLQF